jgi:predicted RNA binding protein YcfA (HicA-like mRNA interferase family)
MSDVGSHHFVKSSDKSSRVLVPQPSDDAHDPLVRNRAKSNEAASISNIVPELEPFLEVL